MSKENVYLVKMVDKHFNPTVECTECASSPYQALEKAQDRYPFYIAISAKLKGWETENEDKQ